MRGEDIVNMNFMVARMSVEVWKCPFCEEKPAVAHCTLNTAVDKAEEPGVAVEAYLQEGCVPCMVYLCKFFFLSL